ncbi:MAG: hypothetical protein ACLS95_04100 [Clostridia bacterium]
MKKEAGITLVSLVVTIIILIILAGISINTLIGDNGIITKAKQAKENTLLAQEEEAKQLNQLYSHLNDVGGVIDGGTAGGDATDKLLNFKKKIAIAISNEGVTTQETDSEEVIVNNIGKILQERTKTATATADNLSSGTTAWVRGEQIIGNGTDVNNAYQRGYQEANALNITSFEWIGCYAFHNNETWHTVSINNATNYKKLYYTVMFKYTTGGGYAFQVKTSGGTDTIFNQATAIQQGLIEPTGAVTIQAYYNQQAVHADAYIVVMGIKK